MAEYGDHFPIVATDRKLVAVHHAAIALGHRRHAARIALALARRIGNDLARQAVGEVELQRVVAIEAGEIVSRGVRREILRGRHPERCAGAFDEPPCAADVIGVVVRDDDVLHGAPGHHAVEVLLPEIERRLDSEAGVHEREAIAVLEDPQVDVVEREGQRHADPTDAGRDRDRFARLRYTLVVRVRYLVVKTQRPFHAGPGELVRK